MVWPPMSQRRSARVGGGQVSGPAPVASVSSHTTYANHFRERGIATGANPDESIKFLYTDL